MSLATTHTILVYVEISMEASAPHAVSGPDEYEDPITATDSPALDAPATAASAEEEADEEAQDNGAEALFVLRARPKKKARKLELKPPDFEIPEFGGGSKRKRYPLDFKLNAIKYAQSVVEGGRGPGGTVGITYATRALGISDKATLAAWIKNRVTFEKEVQWAVSGGGGFRGHRGAFIPHGDSSVVSANRKIVPGTT